MTAEALQERMSRFPKIDTLKAFISGRDIIVKKPGEPDFSIVLRGKARFEPNYVHFSAWLPR